MQFKLSKKQIIFTYIATVLICSIYVIKSSNINGNWHINPNIMIRLTLFLANLTLPVITWISYFSIVRLKHHNILARRKYIWKFRKRVFKIRKQYFIFYVVISFTSALFSLLFLRINLTALLGIFILTIGINFVNWYLTHENFLISIRKTTSKSKIYDKDYLAEQQCKKTFEVNKTPKLDTPKHILVDMATIETIHSLCNNIIFCEDNIENIYNTLNLRHHKPFKIKKKMRFLSLIYLLEFEKNIDENLISEILNTFGYEYKRDYISNRKKNINDDILKSPVKTFKQKIELIIDGKAQ